MSNSDRRRVYRALALVQGVSYIATGAWPLLSMRTFTRVTGPKTDTWLVDTVGALIVVVGAAIAYAGWRRPLSPELALLGASSAATLIAVDVTFVAQRRIGPVYLLDAASETLLLAGWAWVWATRPAAADDR